MPTLVTCLLVKDECDRYLDRVLRRCRQFSDQVLVLDDGSTDGSPDLAAELGCQVRVRGVTGMWGQEAPARAELWHWGAEAAGPGWLLVCDADQIMYGNVRPLLRTTQYNAWAFPLYDCWDSETTYRADGFWQGYKMPRPWLFRPSALQEMALWPNRGLHTGHCPMNFPLSCGVAPEGIFWSHLGWLNPSDRKAKYDRYMAQADQLTPFERAHVASILD